MNSQQEAIDRAVEEFRAGAIDKQQLIRRMQQAMPWREARRRVITLRLTQAEFEAVHARAHAAHESCNIFILKALGFEP